MERGCDSIDWYEEGTSAAERRAAHEAEEDNNRAQLHKLYKVFREVCEL